MRLLYQLRWQVWCLGVEAALRITFGCALRCAASEGSSKLQRDAHTTTAGKRTRQGRQQGVSSAQSAHDGTANTVRVGMSLPSESEVLRLPPEASATSAARGGAVIGAELESDVTVSRAPGMRFVVERLFAETCSWDSDEGPRRRPAGGSRKLPSSSDTSVAATWPARALYSMLAAELLVPTAAPMSAALLLESGRLLKLIPSASATAGPSLGCKAVAAGMCAGEDGRRVGGAPARCGPTSMAEGRWEAKRAEGAGRVPEALLPVPPAPASRRRGAMVALPGELPRAMPVLALDSVVGTAARSLESGPCWSGQHREERGETVLAPDTRAMERDQRAHTPPGVTPPPLLALLLRPVADDGTGSRGGCSGSRAAGDAGVARPLAGMSSPGAGGWRGGGWGAAEAGAGFRPESWSVAELLLPASAARLCDVDDSDDMVCSRTVTSMASVARSASLARCVCRDKCLAELLPRDSGLAALSRLVILPVRNDRSKMLARAALPPRWSPWRRPSMTPRTACATPASLTAASSSSSTSDSASSVSLSASVVPESSESRLLRTGMCIPPPARSQSLAKAAWEGTCASERLLPCAAVGGVPEIPLPRFRPSTRRGCLPLSPLESG